MVEHRDDGVEDAGHRPGGGAVGPELLPRPQKDERLEQTVE